MKKLPLRPYPGEVWYCSTVADFKRAHRKRTGLPVPGDEVPHPRGGITVRMATEAGILAEVVYVVYAGDAPTMAHEFGHVLLQLFNDIGHDPTAGDGEPFCYLLSTLMEEATK